MATETASPRYRGLDSWTGIDSLDAMLEGQMTAIAAVRQALGAIDDACTDAAERLRGDGRLVYAGAGTSGRLAYQDCIELTPTFSWPRHRALVLLAGGEAALTRSVEGAEDDAEAAVAGIAAAEIGPGDVVVGLAASGTTPFTIAAVGSARHRGALTIGVANNPGTPLLSAADHPILLDTGAEVIAGSTRMKAGTAQRAMLTLFSSRIMIALGHVYDGLMVDVQATNRKLEGRSVRILRKITGCDDASAAAALDRAGGSVKLATLILAGLDEAQAHQALRSSAGHLRAALAAHGSDTLGD